MTRLNKIIKRIFDLIGSAIALCFFGWLILVLIFLASVNLKSFGLFTQIRIGYKGKKFTIYKIKTMLPNKLITSSVTTSSDRRITNFGKFLRKYKLDELPQLLNVFLGSMSFVGPRPDVPGFADMLQESDRVILDVKPGITGPASLIFRKEEELLAKQENPEKYNREIIWPKKVKINKDYIKNYTFSGDIKILYRTFFNEK